MKFYPYTASLMSHKATVSKDVASMIAGNVVSFPYWDIEEVQWQLSGLSDGWTFSTDQLETCWLADMIIELPRKGSAMFVVV